MKKFKPTTPSQRHMQIIEKKGISKEKPLKSLVTPTRSKAGRNAEGKITVRHRGGGVKRRFRMVDFKGEIENVKGIVNRIEYDPNRSCFIALINWLNGVKTYVLACEGMKEGYVIEYGAKSEIKDGNRLTLDLIPTGVKVHNIELKIDKGGQLVRSAGTSAVLMAKADDYATIKLPSGEARLINVKCKATIGVLSNSEHRNIKLGKAGKKRYLGFRPTVRGSAMNPCDHPHGGGEGKSPIGKKGPVSPQGKPTLGYKTRKKKKPSNKYIVAKRKTK
ncbi:MAG: 50S ribosomal protein L2 [Candidatus Margulisiibacteriota bacterium]|jgi:large subunit ribosomal protein L2